MFEYCTLVYNIYRRIAWDTEVSIVDLASTRRLTVTFSSSYSHTFTLAYWRSLVGLSA